MLNVSAPLSRETEIHAPYIAVSDSNGNQSLYPIENDSNLMIGSDENCRVRLDGDDIAAEQCMVFRVGDHVTLRDWYSEGCTLLNGQPFSGMQPLNCGDSLSIGAYKLQFVLTENGAQRIHNNPNTVQSTGGVSNLETTHEAGQGNPQANVIADQSHLLEQNSFMQQVDGDVHRMQRELSEAHHQIEQLQAALERQLELDAGEPGVLIPAGSGNPEVAQLKQQVELLNNQLAQQDAELENQHSNTHGNDEADIDSEETERLVGRLEELLSELEQADQRVESMEELLRLSEETVRAEHDEREQLEKWVGQIETLISQKEGEFANERNQLLDQLENSNEARQELQEQIQGMIQQRERSGGNAGNEQLMNQLREQNDRLRDELTNTNSELTSTCKQRDELQSILDNQELPPAIQAKMQAMEIELAQKRAEIARMRAANTDMSVIEKAEPPRSANEADARFQAMRDHLREVRQQEIEAKKEKQLGSRIANLWRRLGKR